MEKIYTKTTLFDQPDKSRTFAFSVAGKSIWIDKHLLAKESPVFSTMLLDGRFADSNEKEIHLPGKLHNDMVEFFACLFSYSDRRPIMNKNFKRNVELADEYNVQNMMTYCQSFTTSIICSLKSSESMTCDLLKDGVIQTCFRYPQFHPFVGHMLPYLAGLKMSLLSLYSPHFPQPMVYALFEACNSAANLHHQLLYDDYSEDDPEEVECSMNCPSLEAYSCCSLCNKSVCKNCTAKFLGQKCFRKHRVCGFLKNHTCELACDFRDFDMERLFVGLRQFSLTK